MKIPEQPDIVKIFSCGKLIYTLHVTKPVVQIIRPAIDKRHAATKVCDCSYTSRCTA